VCTSCLSFPASWSSVPSSLFIPTFPLPSTPFFSPANC
jgi:hypothetical protein